ncbi:uncharacterized protein DAT39_018280 [Clarias magur]|uniref:Uncharacterized protein n=1 Tax=Clarias magur TaxID=1594786 RepID=A0A8J4WUZ4_CLAMG|nr:uncharacterized protein DAT39_018280 [Clarias magur]
MSTSTLDSISPIPKDSAMEINASNGQAALQERFPIITDGQSTAGHPNDTEISSSTVMSDTTLGELDIAIEQKATAELQNGNAELQTETAAQSVTSEDVTMELVEPDTIAAEDVAPESKEPEQILEPVAVEPSTAATIREATTDVAAVSQDADTQPEMDVQEEPVTSTQDVIPEPAMDVSTEHEEPATEVAGQGVTTEQSVGVEPVTEGEAQVTSTEPDMTSMEIPKESIVVAEDSTPEPDNGDKDATVEHEAEERGLTSEPEIREPVADTTSVATEAATQGVAAEMPPAIPGISTNLVPEPQEITKELVLTGQDATTEHDSQEVTTEPGVRVQSVTAAQETVMPPQIMTEVEDIPKDFSLVMEPDATTEPSDQNKSSDHETASGDSTVEPQDAQPVSPSSKPIVPLEMDVEPVELPQDTSSETNAAQEVTAVTASEAQNLVQDVKTQPGTIGHNVTSDDPSVTKEPITESQDAISLTEAVQSEQPVKAEQVVSMPGDEDSPMDTTEAEQGVSSQPTASLPMESTAEHVPMELDGASKKVTTEPVEDVVMETQDESKQVAQDVAMAPIPQIQDVHMDPTENLKAEPQDAGLKDEVQEATNEVMAPAQNGTPESGILESDGAVPAEKESDADEFKHTTVQDDVDQPYAIAQDGTDPSTEVAQAACEDATEPHKGVLSFYSTPAQEAFFSEIQTAKFFSIICEQQIEIEGHTYIPVGICYLEKRKTPCEDVLAYVPLDQDTDVFVDSMTSALSEKWGLNLALCRGQSLLTVGAAGAQVRAAATLLSQRYPDAVRTFSSSVSLNTWLAKSCIISEIADSFTWVERMLQWVTEDEDKRAVLHKMVATLFQQDPAKHSDLTDRLSRSQWERSHDTLDLTVDILEAIMLSLNNIKENHDVQTERTQADDFLIILQNFEFILTLVIMKNVLSPIKSLSQNLQGQPLDVYQAVSSLTEVLSSLSDMKTNIDTHLQSWYQEAVGFASKLQISVDHTSQECLIIYCRDIVSKGAIDHSICEITELFSERALSAVRCMQVVPYVVSQTEGCCADADLFKAYQDDLPDSSSLGAELLKWREKWLNADATQDPLPAGLLDTLNATDAAAYPNIETLLRLLTVLPCFRKEDLIRQGKKSLIEFNQQRSLLELYPL